MKFFSTVFLLFIATTMLQAGGPWAPGAKKGFFQFGAYGIPPSNQLFAINNKTQLLSRKVSDYTFQFYGEYGISKRFWLVAELPFKFVNSASALTPIDSSQANIILPSGNQIGGSLFGLGNVGIAAKYNLYNKGVNISAGLGITAPTGSYNSQNSLRTAFPTWGIMPQISIGTGGNRFYGFIEGGVNFRFATPNSSQKYSHEAIATLEFGYKISKKGAYLSLFSQARLSFRNHADNAEIPTGFFVNNQEYVSFGLKGILPIKPNMGFTLSFGGAFYAVHLQKAPSLGLGFYYKLT
jgi:hypothetical protein